MSDLIVYQKTLPPAIPRDWDFESADKSFDKMISEWRRLSGDAISILWIFYNKLKKQGKRNDLSEISDKLPTWLEWIESKGISDKTPINHFKALGWLPSDSLEAKHTGNAENYTPTEIVTLIRQVFDGVIDFDPASCKMAQEVIQAEEYYTESENGLDVSWHGKVFLNPPYGMPLIQQFTDKLVDELPNIHSAILLTNDQTDTLWFHKCAEKAEVICFKRGRIGFYTPDKEKTAPTNGQAFQYFGPNVDRFIDVFREVGLLVRPI